jgi:amino acid adenylation domain-containing protein
MSMQAEIPIAEAAAVEAEPLFFPLSYSQERLWFLHQFDPGNPTYNHAFAVRLMGELDVEVMQRSLREIIRRHEMLRTVFQPVNGQPVQCVLPDFLPALNVEEVEGSGPEEKEKQAIEIAQEEARRPFDLTQLPLLRVRLLRLAPADHVLVINIHHIIFDAWSGAILWAELSLLYEACRRGEPSPLQELPIQYGDYAVWQREWLQGDVLAGQLQYWKKKLADLPAGLELPSDRPRPALQSFRGASELFAFRQELWDGLKRVAQSEGATLFVVLLAAFETLLMRYSGHEDFAVGIPVANRGQQEAESLIGFFVNTLVMRAELQGNPSFRELMGRVRETTLAAYAHQDVPFEKVVEELHLTRDLSRTPLFQVLFTFLNTPAAAMSGFGGLQILPHKLETGTAKADLVITIGEGGQGPALELNYNTDLFDPPRIRLFLEHYERLLTSIAANPDARVWQLEMLTNAEEKQLAEWNQSGTNYPRDSSIVELFESVAAGTPDAPAIAAGGRQISYRELDQRANQLARYLGKQGAGPGTNVALCVDKSPEMLTGLLAILKTGAAYLPVEMHCPEERVRWMLEDAGSSLLVTQEAVCAQLGKIAARTILLDREQDKIAEEPTEKLPCVLSAENLTYVMYTSGSTGKPKGVAVTHRNVVRLVRNTDYVTIVPDDRIAQLSNLAFDAATFEIWGALLNGACVVLLPRETVLSAHQLAEAIVRERITVLFLTTALFNQVTREVPGIFSPARCVIFGGEQADPVAVRNARLHGAPQRLLHAYGPTENTTFSSWCEVKQVAENALTVPIGRPVANTQLYVLDKEMGLVPAGVPGELYLGGDGVANSYWNRPELTAEKFICNPLAGAGGDRLYRTGDRVRWLAGGNLEFIGRNDAQIKLRGFRVELGEIEAALRQCAGVKDCVVLLKGNTSAEKQLVAYVVPAEQARLETVQLRAALKNLLPEYMVPGIYIELPELPLNENGKINRAVLAEPGESRLETGLEYVPPRTPEEEMLAQIWADVLGVERVSMRDNFFDLGGHSLLATQVTSRAKQAFQVEITVRQLFESPTVSGLAAEIARLVAGGAQAAGSASIQRVPRDGTCELPLSYAQERLWFLDQFQPESDFYNVPVSLGFKGALDSGAMKRSLQEIVRRHEILRMRFITRNGAPALEIEETAEIQLPLADLSHLDAEERMVRARQITVEEAGKPFILNQGPLLRCVLVKLAEQEHVLVATMHHIVTDEWSLGVLGRELSVLYEAFSRGGESPLKELPVQYLDYAAWQRAWLKDDVLDSQLQYWKRQLQGMPAVLALPVDRPRPAIQSFRGCTIFKPLRRELWHALKKLSREENATLYMKLLAAYEVLLMRYTGQEDFGIGTPIANRKHVETEALIGFFVNTLVMRSGVSGNPSFPELLKRVRETALGAYAHQDLPFEKLVEELHPERNMGRTPLFQTMFALQDASIVTETPEQQQDGTAKCDLVLTAAETGHGPAISLNYSTDLFESATIGRILDHYERLLESIVADPGRPVAELAMLTEAEQEQFSRWNQTAGDYPREKTIVDLFVERAKENPEAAALGHAGEQLSYGELERRSNQLAHFLELLKVGPETLVAVCVERSLEMAASMLAVLKAGGAYVPLDPGYPEERLRWMVEQAGARVVLTEEKFAGRLSGTQSEIVCLDREHARISQQSAETPAVLSGPQNLAYMIYTSGSSGTPKGVMVQHGSLMNLTAWHREVYQVKPEDRAAQTAATGFDACTWEIWPYLASGASVHVVDQNTRSSPSQLVEWMEKERITIAFLVTPLAEAVLAEIGEGRRVPHLRALLTGGDRLSSAPGANSGFEFFNHYGPTENTVVATATRIEPGESRDPAMGRPITNTQSYVLDSNLQQAPSGAPGELYVAGESLARGYLNHPELTAEKFLPNPFSADLGARMYRTGDRVRFRHDGNLEFLGRIDDQVKIRGFRVEPQEVEAVLRQCAGIREAVVVAREDQNSQKRLVAYVVADPERAPDATEMRNHLKKNLPEYMVPGAFVLLPQLPLSANGKVDRRALPAPEKEPAGAESAYAPCRTELEQSIAKIWQDLLQLSKIGLDDNFFDLGGHSLLVIKMRSELQKLNLDLSVVELFTYTTIRSLAEYVTKRKEKEAVSGQFEQRALLKKAFLDRRRQVMKKEIVR